MGGVIELKRGKVFSREEANELLPIILRITEKTMAQVRRWQSLMSSSRESENGAYDLLMARKQQAVDEWESKLEKLGATPKGLWMADFDNGQGYFCWKYPEKEIQFEHGYRDGFSKRKELSPLDASITESP